MSFADHIKIKRITDRLMLFFGQFEGGALVLEESKKRYEEKEVWHGPFLGSEVTHYNEPIISGDKYSVVAYSRLHG